MDAQDTHPQMAGLRCGGWEQQATDGPLQWDLTHWPLPVGRIEERHGLTFVYPSAGRFRLRDYRKIPGGNRIELWDGIAVVYPEPGERHQWLVRHLYGLLTKSCPAGFTPYIGPMDVPVSQTTVFAPDLVVLPWGGGSVPMVVDVVRFPRSHSWRARLRGYARAGVRAHWAVEPEAGTITVREVVYRGREAVWVRGEGEMG